MMKYIRLSFIILLVWSISVKSSYAQDAVFSQPFANALYLNPAFAGTGNSQRFGFDFRDQWPNTPSNITAYNISYDRNFIDSNNGIGFLVNVEHYGPNQDLTATNLSLLYSHQVHIKSFTLSAGVQFTYLNLNLDESKIPFSQDFQPIGIWEWDTPTLLRNSITAPDFSGGILGYGKNYFFAFSPDHLSQPDESFYQVASLLQIRYNADMGFMFPVKNVVISPVFLYEQQGANELSTIEWYVSTRHITVGLGYRSQDAIITMLGYQGKLLRIGYSYDWDVSKLTLATGGVHEASLALLLQYSKVKRKKVNGLNCSAF
jgi:type IX secretion system PorP/SprF family membrane protein